MKQIHTEWNAMRPTERCMVHTVMWNIISMFWIIMEVSKITRSLRYQIDIHSCKKEIQRIKKPESIRASRQMNPINGRFMFDNAFDWEYAPLFSFRESSLYLLRLPWHFLWKTNQMKEIIQILTGWKFSNVSRGYHSCCEKSIQLFTHSFSNIFMNNL